MSMPEKAFTSHGRQGLVGLGAGVMVTIALAGLIFANTPHRSTALRNNQLAASSNNCQPASLSLSSSQEACVSTFTVTGKYNDPVAPNDSQVTHANVPPGISCKLVPFEAAKVVGVASEHYMISHGALDGAALMSNFLAGKGVSKNFPNGSPPSQDLNKNSHFLAMKRAVLGEIQYQLDQSNRAINLDSYLSVMHTIPNELPPFLDAPPDLNYSFRGTQGVAIHGNGTVDGNDVSGTITYTILDSYGFTQSDADNLPYASGAAMRYLQTVCGYPPTPGGAHWFPDSVTLTESFSGQL
jgi:hypothetical protein